MTEEKKDITAAGGASAGGNETAAGIEATAGLAETILDRIALYTEGRVKALKLAKPFEEIKREAEDIADREAVDFVFEKALGQEGISFICEVKKASPSRGVISEDFPYIRIAKEYEAAGAAAISVLTEPAFFLGSDSYLSEIKKNSSIPVLRKDFIIDEYQIYEARTLGADAVLLIAALLSEKVLRKFIVISDRLGMSALVEIHNGDEAEAAIRSGARVIGINNRDLKTFTTDMATTERLKPLLPKGILCVSESGISSAADIERIKKCGADAVLIGEAFMKSEGIAGTMQRLRGGASGAAADEAAMDGEKGEDDD